MRCAARLSVVEVVAAAGPAALVALAGWRRRWPLQPVLQIINLRDTLKLTEEQVTKLQVVSDTLNAQNMELAEVVRKGPRERGRQSGHGGSERAPAVRSLEKVQANQQAALRKAQAILSA
jgi:hypothetical protein